LVISTEYSLQRLDDVLHRFLLPWLSVVATVGAWRMALAYMFGKMIPSFKDFTFVVLLAHDTSVSFGTVFELMPRQCSYVARANASYRTLAGTPDIRPIETQRLDLVLLSMNWMGSRRI
jgi:hypothetical protein